MNCRKLFLGILASLAIAPVAHAQNPPASSRPQPQKPLEVPPAVVVLQVDTTAGDSTRVIMQRDLDYGDRLQPLALDSTALADIWQPWSRKINFDPLAQTRANFVVRARPTPTGLHVEVYDARGKLRQEGDFRLPRVPANRLTIIRDSIAKALARKTQVAIASLIADSVARDTLARAAAKPAPNKTTRDRANARRAQVVRDSISADLNRRDVLLRTSIARDTLRADSAYARIALKDSIVRDSVARERRMGIHGVSDELERWLTGTRGMAASKIAFIEGTKLKIVDSDGANERTIPTVGAALSPAWHPSGRYLVYVDADDGGTRIAQVDLRTMKPQLLSASNRGLNITPVYTKDGKSIVWASAPGDSPAELMLASANGGDTVATHYVGRTGFETTSPSFSPDGKQIVFMSPVPLTPQLYTMNVDGTGLRRITPVIPGKRSYRTGADWSPTGEEIAFQQQAGDFQVWTIRVKDRVMTQLTYEGENEDPSWAPDGRHLSITRRMGAIGEQRNIWVLDERTGRLRQLTQSGDARLSDWSPPLKPNF